MVKKGKKIIIFSFIIVLLTVVVAKIMFFDFIRVQNADNLTNIKKNSLLIIQKNKTPNYGDIVFIENPFLEKEEIIRCIALPNDEIEIINSNVFINGEQQIEIFETIKKYRVNCFNQQANDKLVNHFQLADEVNILGVYYLNLNKKMADSLLNDTLIMINQIIVKKGLANDSIFPQTYKYRWNEDNFGAVIVPYKGFSIELNETNYNLYKNTIMVFEGKTIQKDGNNNILIDGKQNSNYVFENDYYFVLNDTRSNLNDSRKWGFLPNSIIKGVVVRTL